MNLSDLAGPDAAGWSDVAVFVRADGSESEPFVVVKHDDAGKRFAKTWIRGERDAVEPSRYSHEFTVRRLGRGQLEPARIVMEGEADLATQVATLREALLPFAELDREIGDEWRTECERARAALAATGPKPGRTRSE